MPSRGRGSDSAPESGDAPGDDGARRACTRRRRLYFALMATCLILFVSAWGFVRLWSVPAAVALCVIAMVIPPTAAIIGNRRGSQERWWDEGR